MKLPEAIALMLEGKVMVDDNWTFHRCRVDFLAVFETYCGKGRGWSHSSSFQSVFLIDGWREATPEELKEIGA